MTYLYLGHDTSIDVNTEQYHWLASPYYCALIYADEIMADFYKEIFRNCSKNISLRTDLNDT